MLPTKPCSRQQRCGRAWSLPVPLHLRNAPTPLMQKLGYGKSYKYAHNYPGHVVEQEHLPKELNDKKYYVPSDSGYESHIKEQLKNWEEKKKSLTTGIVRDINSTAHKTFTTP